MAIKDTIYQGTMLDSIDSAVERAEKGKVESQSEEILYLGDPKASPQEVDYITGNGIQVVSMAEIMDLAQRVKERYEEFRAHIKPRMSKYRADRVRELRCSQNLSYRVIAAQLFFEWGVDGNWFPISNQIAGHALVDAAAEFLHEDPRSEAWAGAPTDMRIDA